MSSENNETAQNILINELYELFCEDINSGNLSGAILVLLKTDGYWNNYFYRGIFHSMFNVLNKSVLKEKNYYDNACYYKLSNIVQTIYICQFCKFLYANSNNINSEQIRKELFELAKDLD